MFIIILTSLFILPQAFGNGEAALEDVRTDAAAEPLRLLQEKVQLQEPLTHKTRGFAKARFQSGQTALNPEASELLQKVEQAPTEVVTHESWFSRLGDAFWSVLVGVIMIPFSLALMWMNERRNAQQESILQLGAAEVRTIASKSVDEKLHGALVHLNDAEAKGLDEVKDRRFSAVRFETGCLRLRTSVQAYQWKETKKEEKKKDNLGGGETTVTRFEYSKVWSDTQINSASFNQPSHNNTISVSGLQCGTENLTNTTVKYGDSHYLPKEMVEQLGGLTNWEDAKPSTSTLDFNNTRFERAGEWFYYPAAAAQAPTIGSVRVCFRYVPDGPVSVLALQTEDKQHPNAATFLPYRLVYRGLCGGLAKDALQEALLAQGKKDGDELYKEEAWTTGPLACLCCCCNVIAMCFAKLAPPQIFAAFHGSSSAKECFEQLEALGKLQKWGLRLVSWVLLYAATYALFQPLLVVLDIFPFLGPYISTGAGWVVGFVVLIFTALLATVVISVAFLIYHPLMGLAYSAGVALVVLAIVGISHSLAR